MTSLRLAFNVTVCNLGPGAPGRLGVFNYEYMMFEWAVREGDSRVEGLLDVKPTQDVDLLDMLGKGGHYSLEVEFSLLDEDGFEVGARAARELLLVSAHVPRAAPDSLAVRADKPFVYLLTARAEQARDDLVTPRSDLLQLVWGPERPARPGSLWHPGCTWNEARNILYDAVRAGSAHYTFLIFLDEDVGAPPPRAPSLARARPIARALAHARAIAPTHTLVPPPSLARAHARALARAHARALAPLCSRSPYRSRPRPYPRPRARRRRRGAPAGVADAAAGGARRRGQRGGRGSLARARAPPPALAAGSAPARPPARPPTLTTVDTHAQQGRPWFAFRAQPSAFIRGSCAACADVASRRGPARRAAPAPRPCPCEARAGDAAPGRRPPQAVGVPRYTLQQPDDPRTPGDPPDAACVHFADPMLIALHFEVPRSPGRPSRLAVAPARLPAVPSPAY